MLRTPVSSWTCSHATRRGRTVCSREMWKRENSLTTLVAKAAAANDTEDMVAGIVEPVTPLFETTGDGELPRQAVEQTISGLRDSGLNDASIEQAVNPSRRSPAPSSWPRRRSRPNSRQRRMARQTTERRLRSHAPAQFAGRSTLQPDSRGVTRIRNVRSVPR